MTVEQNLDSVEWEIREAIRALAEQQNWRSNREWTAAVIRTVCELGERLGFEPCAKGRKRRWARNAAPPMIALPPD